MREIKWWACFWSTSRSDLPWKEEPKLEISFDWHFSLCFKHQGITLYFSISCIEHLTEACYHWSASFHSCRFTKTYADVWNPQVKKAAWCKLLYLQELKHKTLILNAYTTQITFSCVLWPEGTTGCRNDLCCLGGNKDQCQSTMTLTASTVS